MWRKNQHGLGLGVALALLISGCGGGGKGSPSSGPSLDLAVDTPAMAAIDVAWAEAQAKHLSLPAQAQAVLAAMRADSRFVESGISSDNTAWGRFKDGVTYGVGTNDADLQGKAPAAALARVSAGAPPFLRFPALPAGFATAAQASAPAAGELPGAAKAYVFSSLETARAIPTATLSSGLATAGYTVVAGTGRFSDWQGVNGAGVIFSASHGANVPVPGYGETFFITTGERFTGGNVEANLVAALSQGHLVIFTVDVLDSAGTWHKEDQYAFDSHFLTSIASPTMFAANSLMFLDACSGMSVPGVDFGTALGKNSGLCLYGGWSTPVLTTMANETASFFFDRALGLNRFAPVDPSSPAPGDWGAILATMAATTRASDGSSTLNKSVQDTEISTFSFWGVAPLTVQLTTLIPSLSGYSIAVKAATVTLQGSFGSDQGTVTLDGAPLTVLSWSKGSIQVNKPTADRGQLQVISPTKLLSNTFPYESLAIALAPLAPTLDIGGQQRFTVSASNGSTLPSGASYVWTVSGTSGGQVSAGTTTSPEVTYTAGTVAGTDALGVGVYDAGSTLVAQASTSITVQANTPPEHFTDVEGCGAAGRFSGTYTLIPSSNPPVYNASWDNGAFGKVTVVKWQSGTDGVVLHRVDDPGSVAPGYTDTCTGTLGRNGVTGTVSIPTNQGVTVCTWTAAW
jgi:hypothetical protein